LNLPITQPISTTSAFPSLREPHTRLLRDQLAWLTLLSAIYAVGAAFLVLLERLQRVRLRLRAIIWLLIMGLLFVSRLKLVRR
jgi:hypothetical protein